MDETQAVESVLALADVLSCARALMAATAYAFEIFPQPCTTHEILDQLFDTTAFGLEELAIVLSYAFC